MPKVEFHSETTRILPNEWQVAGITRNSAEVVLYFSECIPTYGGTPSDDTVIAICQHLRDRGYKIIFYPMIFVDEIKPQPKPWRGGITSKSEAEIERWFNGSDGYNLVNLAAVVKKILGGHILLTYAADWSEYHHTNGWWFNLDPLWASPDIDFVGIDAYFPLTEDLPHSEITEELIKRGWESGEGWDYYFDWQRKHKHYFATDSPQTPYKYARKNLEYWWSNPHYNPDSTVTDWQPKMICQHFSGQFVSV